MKDIELKFSCTGFVFWARRKNDSKWYSWTKFSEIRENEQLANIIKFILAFNTERTFSYALPDWLNTKVSFLNAILTLEAILKTDPNIEAVHISEDLMKICTLYFPSEGECKK